MALDEINEYPVTATGIAVGSFLDIDQLVSPGIWESQKVPDSVIIAYIIANAQNFSNADLVATANRLQNTGGFEWQINTDGLAISKEANLFLDATVALLGFDESHFRSAVAGNISKSVKLDIQDSNSNTVAEFSGTGTIVHAPGTLSTDIALKVRNSADTADILTIAGDGSFVGLPAEFQLAVSDETTDLTTGASKITFRMPYAMTLTDVRASVTTAPTGATISVGVNQGGVSILSTDVSIDISEKTSVTAAVPPVISTSALTDDGEITIDIDQIGSTIAGTGLKITLIGTRA